MFTMLLSLSPTLFFPAFGGANTGGDATHIFADARAVEAVWRCFPGFVADIDIELEGNIANGRVLVLRDGRVFLEHIAGCHRVWGNQKLNSIIRERMGECEKENRKWMRVNTSNRLAICRSDDPFGSCVLIENKRIVAVDHRLAGSKQRLTTLKTMRNGDGKLLPVAQVLHSWHPHTSELEATEAMLLGWERVGGFDLPNSIQVLSAAPRPVMGRIVLTRHQLFNSVEPQFAGDRSVS